MSLNVTCKGAFKSVSQSEQCMAAVVSTPVCYLLDLFTCAGLMAPFAPLGPM